MPGAFEFIDVANPAPCLLVCDHASRDIPSQFGTLGIAEAETWGHIAWDIGAGDLTRELSQRLGATAILSNWSRLVIDCNRRLDHPTSFIQQNDGITITGNHGLSAEDRAWRISNIFDPYHQAIAAELDRRQHSGVNTALVSIHSFTPHLEGQARPWHVGILWDRDDRLPAPVIRKLREVEGLLVGDNEPYSGRHPTDYTVHMHGARRGLAHIAFEVRQDLLCTAEGVAYWGELLAGVLAPCLADPARLKRRVTDTVGA